MPLNILVNLPTGFFTEPVLQPVWERLRRIGTVVCASHDTADEIRPDLARAEALLMWSWPVLDSALLSEAPHLRFLGALDISQCGARAALERGLAVSVSRAGWSPAVAECALGLILNLLRRHSVYHACMREAREAWVREFPADIDPLERELTGVSVGIVGFGAVGRRLAELLQPFHPDLRVCDPYVSDETLARGGARRADLDELLRHSEVVVLCASSNVETHRLLGTRELAMLRSQAVLVNVARAALVDTTALVERLGRGDLLAALDVFDDEPLPPRSSSAQAFRCVPYAASCGWFEIVGVPCRLLAGKGRPRRHVLHEGALAGLDG